MLTMFELLDNAISYTRRGFINLEIRKTLNSTFSFEIPLEQQKF